MTQWSTADDVSRAHLWELPDVLKFLVSQNYILPMSELQLALLTSSCLVLFFALFFVSPLSPGPGRVTPTSPKSPATPLTPNKVRQLLLLLASKEAWVNFLRLGQRLPILLLWGWCRCVLDPMWSCTRVAVAWFQPPTLLFSGKMDSHLEPHLSFTQSDVAKTEVFWSFKLFKPSTLPLNCWHNLITKLYNFNLRLDGFLTLPCCLNLLPHLAVKLKIEIPNWKKKKKKEFTVCIY